MSISSDFLFPPLPVIPLQTLSVTSLKLTASSRPTAPPSGSANCLRFRHWLTLCTLNKYSIYLLTYLIPYLPISLSSLSTLFPPLKSRTLGLCCEIRRPGLGPQPKSNLMHYGLKIWDQVATNLSILLSSKYLFLTKKIVPGHWWTCPPLSMPLVVCVQLAQGC